MEAERRDMPPKESENNRLLKIGGVLALISIVALYFSGAFDEQFRKLAGRDIVFTALYRKYRIDPLPAAAFGVDGVSGQMKVLDNEPCNVEAINNVARFLSEAGFKRDAATLLLGYADACPDSVWQVYYAGNYFYDLGDYQEALKAAELAVHMNPGIVWPIYLRARALSKLDRHKEALTYYEDVISRFQIQRTLGLEIYNDAAKSYAAIGQNCEAASTLQTYIGFDTKARDTEALENEIKNYVERGNCNLDPGVLSEKLEIRDNTVVAQVFVNGVVGKFVVDTGASLVSITPEFAERANIRGDGHKILTHTANGKSWQESINLETVSLGRLDAVDVPGTILPEAMEKGVDGLLGMSFLSKFSIKTRGNTMIISQDLVKEPRATRQRDHRLERRGVRRHRRR